jgi:hypothetical protein
MARNKNHPSTFVESSPNNRIIIKKSRLIKGTVTVKVLSSRNQREKEDRIGDS